MSSGSRSDERMSRAGGIVVPQPSERGEMTRQHTDDAFSSAVQSDEASVVGNNGGLVAGVPTAYGDAPQDGGEPWIDALARARDEFDGVDLELSAREPARGFSFEG